jgi:NADH-quinone oxidoreductase subunit L
MEWIKDYAYLIPVFPLLGAIFNGINAFFDDKWLGKEKTRLVVSVVAPLSIFISFILSLFAFFYILGLSDGKKFISFGYTWLKVGHLEANVSFLIDPLSSIMLLVVTGVGFLIHVYSIGYMWHDKGYSRYFSYLNLFVFSMLLLVLGDNILLLFVGWEGVGLCSYLLIGFWYSDRNNAIAGMKAFVVNRIGDYGFLIGIFLLFWGPIQFHIGNPLVSFKDLKMVIDALPEWYKTAIALCLFVGAVGKSAQIPLYVWLPDAMAGPTPVSSLIHAATMVTAGVYMIGRLNFLYTQSPIALTVVSIIAALTAFFSATIGIAQNDIKKVLAYSTVSQLGYMFLGMGSSAYSSGIFHLMTHAFFKGLLFMGAGSVIVALHHEQDIRKMGGLRKRLPITFWTFLMATLAIAGVPGFSGFFSKDEILFNVFISHNEIFPWLPKVLWFIGVITAGITSFYMFRLVFLTFFGEYRGDKHTYSHIKESPKVMTIPLIILAILSVVGGYVGLPEGIFGKNLLKEFLSSVFGEAKAIHHHHSISLELSLMLVSVLVSLIGIALAYYLYIVKPELPDRIVNKIKWLYNVVYNKYFVDEFYYLVIVSPLLRLERALANFDYYVIDGIVNGVAKVMKEVAFASGRFDFNVVDGLVNGVSRFVGYMGGVFRRLQTGFLNYYLYYIFAGVVLLFVLKIIL